MGKSTITYNGSVIAETEENGNINVIYDGNTIATVAEGETKTLKCAGKVMRSNLYIGARTLLCKMSEMISDVIIAVASGFPAEPSSYTLIETHTTSKLYTITEAGWYQIEVFGASGKGGSMTAVYETSYYKFGSGGGGGGGGYSCSRVKMNVGDYFATTIGNVGAATSAEVYTTADTWHMISVASGANGADGTRARGSNYEWVYYGGAGGAGGVATGGNYANFNGVKGGDGTSRSDGVRWESELVNALGGAAGYKGGNAGGNSGKGKPTNSSLKTYAGASGLKGFVKIYKGNSGGGGGSNNPTFTVVHNGQNYTYEFESGMSFEQFVNSSYNDGSFSIGTANVLWNISNATVPNAVMFNSAALCTSVFDPAVLTLDIMVINSDEANVDNRMIVADKTYYCAATW